jgi:hypothetical protein
LGEGGDVWLTRQQRENVEKGTKYEVVARGLYGKCGKKESKDRAVAISISVLFFFFFPLSFLLLRLMVQAAKPVLFSDINCIFSKVFLAISVLLLLTVEPISVFSHSYSII